MAELGLISGGFNIGHLGGFNIGPEGPGLISRGGNIYIYIYIYIYIWYNLS